MDNNGLIHGFILDGRGGGREIGLEEAGTWTPEQGILWLHFDYTSETARNWVLQHIGRGSVEAEALLTEETRPRVFAIEDGALIALRGVNLNPGSDPEDMVSVRLWIDGRKIISSRRRALLSVRDLAASLQNNKGPKTCGEFITRLANGLTNRIEDTIETIEDRIADLEEQTLEGESYRLRSQLAEIRRETIMLRRYLAPQREALAKLFAEEFTWLSPRDRIHGREVTDRLIRFIEDLDMARDRSALVLEEIINRISEKMNERMYILSLFAAIFLPLGFLTGLLGINVGGIPGANNDQAFWLFVLFLVVLSGAEIVLFRVRRWL
ncbi:MAG: zinc transporter ZntB [Desulfobulbaceae bacterium]